MTERKPQKPTRSVQGNRKEESEKGGRLGRGPSPPAESNSCPSRGQRVGTGAAGSPPGGHLLSPYTTGLSGGAQTCPGEPGLTQTPPYLPHPPPSYDTLDALTLTRSVSLSALLTPSAGKCLPSWLLRVVWICRWALTRAPILPQA